MFFKVAAKDLDHGWACGLDEWGLASSSRGKCSGQNILGSPNLNRELRKHFCV